MLIILIVALTLVCAIQAIVASRLLHSALWLAGTSVLTALIMYMLGAHEVAAVELSVGAGLVTILFVFAINITGEEPLQLKSLVPKYLALILTAIGMMSLIFMILPAFNIPIPAELNGTFRQTIWVDRSMDLLLQILLIFAGVLGIIGLLSDDAPFLQKEQEE